MKETKIKCTNLVTISGDMKKTSVVLHKVMTQHT